jgi:hypothetical protein
VTPVRFPSFERALHFAFARLRQKLQRPAFVDGDVFGFVALNEVLGFRLGHMMNIALEIHVGRDFLRDDSANSTLLRVPSTWSPRLNDFFIQTQLFSNRTRALPRTR